MTDWFYRSNNSMEAGPISPRELLELIRIGTIQEKTLVRKGNSPWVAAAEVNGLWEAAGRPSAVFDCPRCSKPIPKPPTRCPHCQQMIQKATGHLVHHQVPTIDDKNQSLRSDSPFGTRPGLYD